MSVWFFPSCRRSGKDLTNARRDNEDGHLNSQLSQNGKCICIVILPTVVKGQRNPLRRKLSSLLKKFDELRGSIKNKALLLQVKHLLEEPSRWSKPASHTSIRPGLADLVIKKYGDEHCGLLQNDAGYISTSS